MLGRIEGKVNCSVASKVLRHVDMRTPRRSLDLLDVVILSVLPVIGVASYMALRVTGKRDARDIVLDEERFRTQG
jgi:hypothetical protein